MKHISLVQSYATSLQLPATHCVCSPGGKYLININSTFPCRQVAAAPPFIRGETHAAFCFCTYLVVTQNATLKSKRFSVVLFVHGILRINKTSPSFWNAVIFFHLTTTTI